MFWKIGFIVEFAIIALAAILFMKSNPMKNEGAASWIDIYSKAPTETIKFLGDTFGIEVANTTKSVDGPMPGMEYSAIKARGQLWPFAGVMGMPLKEMVPHTMSYLTVKDYKAAHDKMIANGAKAVLTDQYAGGMRFGIYIIPGGVDIGIAQWERAKK
ncbi:MAG: hypothetical protein LBL46_01175 [Rickettsiales bacterium]|nr:hypothetical protein [Rickettsiales bacterium]